MAFVVDWFYDMLSFFGIYYKDAKVLFLGLDGAGKTTLLQILKTGKIPKVPEPTMHAGKEELVYGSLKIEAHDLGGHVGVRKGWKHFFVDIDGIIFLVDADDRDRFPEARAELESLMGHERLLNVPFLIMGNKVDKPTAATETELRSAINLMGTTGKDVEATKATGIRPCELFMVSLKTRDNVKEAFDWLSTCLK